MTDKTPKNKAENPVNTPTALAGTTDTARDGELKGRALPQADALKARFKAGSIPLQTDFADLIDLANMGRQAVGGAEGQTGPANGFTLSSMGRLELKPNAAKGISVDKDGIAVKAEGNKGLQVTNNGVSVKPGNGIAVNSSGVNIKLAKGANTNGGEGHGTDGATSGNGGGLNLTANGLSIDAGDGIQIDSKGVSIKLAANSGLSADETNGLKIVPEQMFQKNMVMMFAGTEAEMPKGWALCDGNGGRPDLRDRFVLGSTGFTNINQNNGKRVTGTNADKQYMVNSDAKTPAVSVTVSNHKLTTSEIPGHSHYDGVRYNYDSGIHDIMDLNEYGLYDVGRKGSYGSKYAKLQKYSDNTALNLRLVNSSTTGGSGGHNHTASAIQSSHQHNTNVVPPYYILAFIIKV